MVDATLPAKRVTTVRDLVEDRVQRAELVWAEAAAVVTNARTALVEECRRSNDTACMGRLLSELADAIHKERRARAVLAAAKGAI